MATLSAKLKPRTSVTPKAISGTVPVTGPVAPTSAADTYPSHLAQFGKGGWCSAPDATARDAIPAERREVGMVVVTQDDGRCWKLETDNTWKEIGTVSGIIAPDAIQLTTGGSEVAPALKLDG